MKTLQLQKLNAFKSKYENNLRLKKICLVFSYVFLFLYAFSIPFFSGRSGYNSISILICVLMIAFMLFYSFCFGKICVDNFTLLLLLFIFSVFLSMFFNFSFSPFPKAIILNAFVGFSIYQFMLATKNEFALFLAILAAAILFAFAFLFHYRNNIFPLNFDFDNRLGSFFDNENEIGKEFGFFATLSMVVLFNTKKTHQRILCIFFYFLFVFLILLTGSVSNLIAAIIIAVFSIFYFQKNNRHRFIVLILVVAVVGFFILLLQLPFMSYFKGRLLNIIATLWTTGEAGDSSSGQRLYALITYLGMFLYKPLFGVGYSQGGLYTLNGVVSHSTIGELLGTTGILGFLSFEAILLLPFAFSIKKQSKNNALPLMFYMVVFQLFISSIFYSKFEYIFIGIAYSLRMKYSKTPEKQVYYFIEI